MLRLDLDKESYERAGLQGRPTRSGGRKHIKARYGMQSTRAILKASLMVFDSSRGRSETAIDAAWQERLRAYRLGGEERPQPVASMAVRGYEHSSGRSVTHSAPDNEDACRVDADVVISTFFVEAARQTPSHLPRIDARRPEVQGHCRARCTVYSYSRWEKCAGARR